MTTGTMSQLRPAWRQSPFSLSSQGTDKHTSSGAWVLDNFLTGKAHLVRWVGMVKGQGQTQLHRKVCNGWETVHGLCHQAKCRTHERPCFPSWAEIGKMECLRIFTRVPTPNTIGGLLAAWEVLYQEVNHFSFPWWPFFWGGLKKKYKFLVDIIGH